MTTLERAEKAEQEVAALKADFAAFKATAAELDADRIRKIEEVATLRRDLTEAQAACAVQHKLQLHAQGEWGKAIDRESALRRALDRVLTEAGLQAHRVGCPNRLMRTRVVCSTTDPCPGCDAEERARVAPEAKP